MDKLIQVKLREFGQVLFFSCGALNLKIGDYVIVETDRGLDYGHFVYEAAVQLDKKHPQEEPIRKILRIANESDLKHIEENRLKAKEAEANCAKKIQGYKLDMKLVSCEYSFDHAKIVFYFTAEGRVDFRELVKELAKIFKARIELRQIGVRDEAKLFWGFGSCGRQLCCVSFLKDFEPVMIKMAKDQGLPLNPPKLSGLCGRLMCCLSYEHCCYKELSRGLPKEGEHITTKEGKGKVIGVNILKRQCLAELEDKRQVTMSY